MRRIKRRLALLLAAVLLVSAVPVSYASESEMQEAVVQETAEALAESSQEAEAGSVAPVSEPESAAAETAEEGNAGQPETEGLSDPTLPEESTEAGTAGAGTEGAGSEGIGGGETAVETETDTTGSETGTETGTEAGTEEETETEEESETETETEEESETETETETEVQELLLNYLVVDQPYIVSGNTQSVVISIGSGEEISSAVLAYHRQSDGQSYETAASGIDGDVVLFQMAASGAGVYVLDSVRYVVAETEFSVVFSEIGINAKYGVDTEVDTDPDAQVIEADGEETDPYLDVSVSRFDAQGNQISESSIGEAIAAQQASIPAAMADDETDGNVVVMLDPGHGGDDGGASYYGYKESDLTLKIASYCKAELEEYYGVTVYMTRTDDTYVTLADRILIASEYGADIFVSIHLNASESSSANGAEVYYPNSNYNSAIGKAGGELAAEILAQLAALGLTDRGTKILNSQNGTYYTADGELSDSYTSTGLADYYAVIRDSKLYGFPGIIVEHAFLSNALDVSAYLSTESGLKSLGVADATGIANYLGLSKEKPAETEPPQTEPETPVFDTVYQGVDYAAVYDFNYYVNKYSDLKAAFGKNQAGALQHFVTYGMNEGRQAISTFDVQSYRRQYQDLRLAFGWNWKSYYLHYINYGQKEGRIATGVSSIQNPVTSWGGVDYSCVYDYNYYIGSYSDLRSAFGNDDIGALQHFIANGMAEGRQAIATFDVTVYKNNYTDLQKAFGSNLKLYYLHYIEYGYKEGRTGSSSQNSGTYSGNYSLVYDFDYYINKYSDLKAIYSDDRVGALQHFITFGMKEGRQAKASFNVSIYKSNYSDLQKAFGNDLKLYYLHYIQYGYKEGRNAVTALNPVTEYTPIMSSPTTTVAQMVAYYNSYATYPSYYSTTDAPTITAFCQIYYNESVAEGIDPAVAFCQAMKETGFLKFGGIVPIEAFNFCGLGATDAGVYNSFDSVTLGVRAQVQHLKAYASKAALNQACVDPRFTYVTRGCAIYVEWLGIQENPNGFGWAAAENYGYSIRDDYMAKLYQC